MLCYSDYHDVTTCQPQLSFHAAVGVQIAFKGGLQTMQVVYGSCSYAVQDLCIGMLCINDKQVAAGVALGH